MRGDLETLSRYVADKLLSDQYLQQEIHKQALRISGCPEEWLSDPHYENSGLVMLYYQTCSAMMTKVMIDVAQKQNYFGGFDARS